MLNKKEIFNLNGKADWFNYEEVHTIFLINNQIDVCTLQGLILNIIPNQTSSETWSS